MSKHLDLQVCSRARLSRDPRFDGKFFIGVRGSGVYCRSICPAPTAKEKNVRYFPTAAAAAEAGYRPCLRCRPECSPCTPAWLGTSSTVSRALRLISERGMEDGGVEMLASRLGVGSRHLRRLFRKHLGASPASVAHTQRLHFAKKLIDETKLPMTQVAVASGFGCVRRFNAGIRKGYHRTPTQLRKLARQTLAQLENQYLFRLRFRPPYDWDSLLAFLAARAIPGVEAVNDGVYRRSISISDQPGWFEVSMDQAQHALIARVEFGDPRSLFFVTERIRAMFDLNADWAGIARELKGDPLLAPQIRAHPGQRIPGCWNGFELAVRAILGQQVSVKGASTLAGRMTRAYGKLFPATTGISHIFPIPAALCEADFQGLGLTRARGETIRALARAVCENRISFEHVADSSELLTRLRKIPGIGDWTAEYVSMRALGEPDAFPASDLGLLRATGSRSVRELERRSEAWRPWRAYAAMHLWSLCGTLDAPSKNSRQPRINDRAFAPLATPA